MSGIFITGTDTGVGKTYITALMAQSLHDQGLDVGIMKPISCGPQKENDAVILKELLNIKDDLGLINPIQLKDPLSPYAAAKKEKKQINLDRIFSSYKRLAKEHDMVLVEGVGGVLVPIEKEYLVVDMIKDFNLPTIIVARAGLGTLNHTLLTIEALKKRKCKIKGIVMNGYTGKEISEKDNAEIIHELTGIPILAKVKLMT
ncbi:MAG: dethiobiotin synthase [bacterium]